MDDLILIYDKLLTDEDINIKCNLIKERYLYKYLLLINKFNIDINNLDIHSLSESEVKEVIRECFYKTFGNKKEKFDFFTKSSRLYQVNKLNQMNGTTSFSGYLGTDKYTLDILLPITFSYEGVIATMHEYGHAMEIDHYPVYQNLYYKELFAILVEMITSIQINSILGNDSIELNQKKIRLAYSSKTVNDYVNFQYLFHSIDKKEKELNEYDYLTYVISTIYGILLSDYYKYYPNEFIIMLNKVIDGEIKIEDFIKYYGLNLEKKDTINEFKKTLKKLEYPKN